MARANNKRAGGHLTNADLLVGSKVDYFSSAKQSWLPVTITKVDPDTGAIEIDMRKGVWISRRDQEGKLRVHMRPGKAQLEWARSVMGSDRFNGEMDELFFRHATKLSGRCEVAVLWSAMPALAADLDILVGLCGSLKHLEAETLPVPRRGPGAAADGIALTRAAFSLAFWKTLDSTLREYGQAFPCKRAPQRRSERCAADYIFERDLGRGTFGVVRLVRERSTGTRLAVKAVDKARMRNSLEELEVEVEWLCRVDHPNIVKLHKFYADATHVNLVMDFCSGGDLSERILHAAETGERFSHAYVAHVMLQLMRAISHVHARGLVHLDIKGLNIMLTHRVRATVPPVALASRAAAGQDHDMPHLMLIDLGLAQLFQPGCFIGGFPGGTPQTMAPEIWRGEVTPAADVFSCGVVFFELCSLRMDPMRMSDVLRGGNYLEEAKEFWRLGGPDWDWNLLRHYPREARELCASMLHRSRRDRPLAAACVASDFLCATRAGGRAGAAGKLSPSDPKVCSLMRRLGTFHSRSLLYHCVAMSLARRWPANELPTVQAAFLALDASGTGFLDTTGLAGVLQDFGVPPEGAAAAARAVDLNRDGLVDWTEFVAASVPLGEAVFEQTLRQKFDRADADHDGRLSRQELATLLPGCTADEAPVVELHRRLAPAGRGIDWLAFRSHFVAQDSAASPAPAGGPALGGPLRAPETVRCQGPPSFRPPRRTPFDNPNPRTAMMSQ
mmetsp:Transcript_32281/g.94409  ORF Transcript_32281/g.94409 Transcript_32281/m.94409 type:complete len:729 (-) Transcript_32281:71-2257(-)